MTSVSSKHLDVTMVESTEFRRSRSAGLKSNKFHFSAVTSLIRQASGRIGLAKNQRQALDQRQAYRSTDIIPILPRLDLARDYLFWALLTDSGFHRQFGDEPLLRREPSLVKARTAEDFFQIPLPPLAEQKRIARILDAADALRTKRREALAQLDILIQSTFLDMFGDPVTNPLGWEQCVVGDVVHAAKDGPHVSPRYAESGVPFLSTRHIKPGEVVWEDLKYIDQDEANRQWKKCKPELGDILYTKGGTTGIAARVATSKPFAVWVHVALLKLDCEEGASDLDGGNAELSLLLYAIATIHPWDCES